MKSIYISFEWKLISQIVKCAPTGNQIYFMTKMEIMRTLQLKP